MTDKTELKRLAEAANAVMGDVRVDVAITSESGPSQAEIDAVTSFLQVATPVAVLALIAENELARMRIKELDLMFGRFILGMRSALIEEEHGKGPAAAMEWIYNSLAGPGELPPEGETDSQAYFDREIVAVDDGMQEVMAFHEGRRAAMAKEQSHE